MADSIFGLYVLDSRPSAEFNFESAKNKLANLDIALDYNSRMALQTPGDALEDQFNLGQDPSELGEGTFGKLMRLACWIDLDSRLTIGCSGAILSYLQRRRSVEYLPGDEAANVAFRVRSTEMFALSDTLFINVDTLVSLQIIQSESHPNAHMQGYSTHGAKEGLSVYGLFHHFAHTPQGKHKLRQIFLRPSMDLEIIEERQRTIAILLRPNNGEVLDNLIYSLKRIKNIRTIIVHLQKGVSQTTVRGSSIQRGVWASLQQFTYHALKIVEALRELEDGRHLAIVNRCLEALNPYVLRRIGEQITGIVDFPRSAEQHRTTVLQGVDEGLDNLKRTYDGLGDLLNEIATQLASELPEWAQKYIENCIFFPQLGFLTVVPLDPVTGKGRYEGEGTDDDVWERRFCTEDVVYYKNRRMREVDDRFGDIYGIICGKLYCHDITTPLNLGSRHGDRDHTRFGRQDPGTRASCHSGLGLVW
jgi:DNA mismatch repair protein MSH5